MPNVTMIGAAGRVTVPFSSEAAASIAGGIENILLGLVNRGTIAVEDFSGTGTPTLPSGQLAAVLINSSGYTQFDSPAVPFIEVDSSGTTNISNHRGVQTIVAGGGSSLLYTAIDNDSVAGASAVVWVSGGTNGLRATGMATAEFNLDGGVSLVDGSFGVTDTRLMSGLAVIDGANDTFVPAVGGTTRLSGSSGATTVEVGGSELPAAALFAVGSAGGTVRMHGDAALGVQDPFKGRIIDTANAGPVVEGRVMATVSGIGNFFDGGGGSPTITLSDGSLYLTNTAQTVTVIDPTGNATICGGMPGFDHSGHLGWQPNIGTGSIFVAPSEGSVTLYGGHTGGLVFGGHAGNNLLIAGDFAAPGSAPTGAPPAVTSTLIGGGGGDTLAAGPGGANQLVASYGNTTLIGAGSVLGNIFVLGRTTNWQQASQIGPDLVVGNNGSNAFILGSGNATIISGHAVGPTGHDVYVDFGNQIVAPQARVEITDFRIGTDIVELIPTGGQVAPTVVGVSHALGNTVLLLSDGLQIAFDHISGVPISALVTR